MLDAACTVSDTMSADADSCNWRTLALALGSLLAQTHALRVTDIEGQASELAQQNAAYEVDVLAGRDSMLGLVVHELKMPLAIIKAYAELLEAQLADQSEARATTKILHHILEQADLMADWVECMLDTQRLRLGKLPLKLGRVDVVQLAQTLAEEFQQTTRDQSVRVVVSGRPPCPIRADRCRLRQLVSNLLANAVKYSAGATIEVRVGVQERANGGAHVMHCSRRGTGHRCR